MAKKKKTRPELTFTAIQSSTLAGYNYDKEKQLLTMKFKKNDTEYTYHPVPEQVVKDMLAAESQGVYFSAMIRTNKSYTVTKIK